MKAESVYAQGGGGISNSDVYVFLAGVILFFIGVFLFIKGLKWFRRKRQIENTPTSKIRSIAMGFIEVCGAVSPVPGQEMLKNPLLKNDCIYYRYIEEKKRGRNYRNPEGYWSIIKDEEAMTRFYLKDDTGSVLVDPKGAIFDVDLEGKSKACVSGENKRITVYSIEPLDNIYILGTAGKNSYPTGTTCEDGTDQIMIQKGKNYYYISDNPECKLLKNLGRDVWIGIYGGAALSLISLAMILFYLGAL